MKKLGNEWTSRELGEKINEIVNHIGAIENDLEMMHWNSPKKLEVKPTSKDYFDEFHKWCDEGEGRYFGPAEMQAITQAMKYAAHRYNAHGIKHFMAEKDRHTFMRILKSL
jgi:hypothetical protein